VCKQVVNKSLLSLVPFYGEKAVRKARRQPGLSGFNLDFTGSARAESSCALFTPFFKQG